MASGLMQLTRWRSTTLIVSESALILGVVVVASQASWPFGIPSVLPKALVVMSVCQICLYYGDLYDNPHLGGDRGELLIRTLRALGATFLILAAIYTVFPALIIAR